MNISRTGFLLDMQFSQGVDRHFVLSFSIRNDGSSRLDFQKKSKKHLKDGLAGKEMKLLKNDRWKETNKERNE